MIRVLLVDDQPIVWAGLRTLLGVNQTSPAIDAVRLTLDLRPDVVLMDVRMPGIDGIRRRPSRSCDPGCAHAVCVLTTYSVDDYVLDALAAGASGSC